MADTTRNWRRLVPVFALLFAGVASVAFAIGMTTGGSNTALAANATTVPGHPELGTGWKGPMGWRMGGPGAVEITIKSIDGTKLSLQTTDGWTRTIDAAGATVTKGGQSVSLGDLKVGDMITFREARQSDGSYKITAISVELPTAAGTVTSIGSSSITIKQADGTSKTIAVTGTTTYRQGGSTVSKSAVGVGDRIAAEGSVDSSGAFTATTIQVEPVAVVGTVSSKTPSEIVVTQADGTKITVKVTASTTYRVPGQTNATLANIAVGDRIAATGTHNADGTLSATTVLAGRNDQPGFGPEMGGMGRGFGRGHGMGGFGFGPFGGPGSNRAPGSSSAPTPAATSSASSSGI